MEKVYKELRESFTAWNNIERTKLINDLDNFYNYSYNYRWKKILKIEIINNKLHCDNSHLINIYNNLFFNRSESVIKLFKMALNRINKSNIKLRNFVCYFTINDYTISKTLPIFSFAKPINTNGILIPDWTFINLSKEQIINDWDDIKDSINNVKNKDKDNVIFFQGANTSKIVRKVREYKSDIRENIKLLSQNDNRFIVKIDEPPTPITEWKKYKYLLDLPGAYPWSVRFKELLMMKSLIIKVDVEKPWINFYSALLKPNIDYIQIKYNYEDEPKKIAEDVHKKILQTYKYMENHPYKMNKMINNAYKNISKLTMDDIIDYMVLLIKLSEELLHDDNFISKKTKSTKNKTIKLNKATKTKKTTKATKATKLTKKQL